MLSKAENFQSETKKIDQGMLEAGEKADQAVQQATTALVTGIVSSGSVNEQRSI